MSHVSHNFHFSQFQDINNRLRQLENMIKQTNQTMNDDSNNAKLGNRVNNAIQFNKTLQATKKKLEDILSKNADSTNAVMAYQNIISDINAAKNSSDQTKKTVNNILNRIKNEKLDSADDIKKTVDDNQKRLNALDNIRKQQQKRLKTLEDQVNNNKSTIEKQTNEIKILQKRIDCK